MPKLLLFDVDGTLILTGGAGARAMTRAFEEVFHIPAAFDGISMPGRTDPLIVADACARLALASPDPLVARFRARYAERLAEEMARPLPGKRVMPGVRELLDRLAGRPGVFLALLTGNYAETARIKLEHFDLWRPFRCGAFGEDAADRNGLVEVAISRAIAHGAPRPRPKDVLVVGDTPLDVACARAAGARAIAVATGGCDAQTLAACGADVVFEDLRESEVFLALLEDEAGGT
jgi:phosphoglycolate phosphatase-like HAD superfamily hydrolase